MVATLFIHEISGGIVLLHQERRLEWEAERAAESDKCLVQGRTSVLAQDADADDNGCKVAL